jgi:hypothetical protein
MGGHVADHRRVCPPVDISGKRDTAMESISVSLSGLTLRNGTNRRILVHSGRSVNNLSINSGVGKAIAQVKDV